LSFARQRPMHLDAVRASRRRNWFAVARTTNAPNALYVTLAVFASLRRPTRFGALTRNFTCGLGTLLLVFRGTRGLQSLSARRQR
jgi:hypothetical protein